MTRLGPKASSPAICTLLAEQSVLRMTICISAICADQQPGAPALVVAADRMQTWGDDGVENATSKIFPVSVTTVALVSGEARRGSQIIRDIRGQLKTAAEGAGGDRGRCHQRALRVSADY